MARCLALTLFVFLAAMQSATAFPRDELAELLRQACFSAFDFTPTDSIVKWDIQAPVKAAMLVDHADDELDAWLSDEFAKFQWAISDGQHPLIEPAGSLQDADIVILSLESQRSFQGNKFEEYLAQEFSLSESDTAEYRKTLDEMYSGERDVLYFVSYAGTGQGVFRLSKYVGIIAPDATNFRSVFLRLISAALGCGNGQLVPLTSIKSVHTTLSNNVETVDLILLDFLYRSDVANGDSRDVVMQKLDRWIDERRYEPKFVDK